MKQCGFSLKPNAASSLQPLSLQLVQFLGRHFSAHLVEETLRLFWPDLHPWFVLALFCPLHGSLSRQNPIRMQQIILSKWRSCFSDLVSLNAKLPFRTLV